MQDHNEILNNFEHVVAIGGGHGLGRVLSSLSFLGSKLTGIVTTTDNGGSTGRLRKDKDCIAWGDLRNCLSQLAQRPSVGSLLFEHRFQSECDINGHNLGNLMLKALDELCVRPLDAINLVRNMLNIDTRLLPMSEQATHLSAMQQNGLRILGEVDIDNMEHTPISLSLEPMVEATCEACEAVREADLIILGPGSFLTSIMPPLLLPKLARALANSKAEVVLIDNLTAENSPIAQCDLAHKLNWCHEVLGLKVIDKVLCHNDIHYQDGHIHYHALRSAHHDGLHDKQALVEALALMVSDKRSAA